MKTKTCQAISELTQAWRMTELTDDELLNQIRGELTRLTEQMKPERPMQPIEDDLCEAFGIDRETCPDRKGEWVKTRQVIMTLLMQQGAKDYEAAAYYGIDRCTALHAIKVIKNIIETKDKKYYPVFEKILGEYAGYWELLLNL